MMCIKCGVGNAGLACPDENGVWGGVCFHCGEFTPAEYEYSNPDDDEYDDDEWTEDDYFEEQERRKCPACNGCGMIDDSTSCDECDGTGGNILYL